MWFLWNLIYILTLLKGVHELNLIEPQKFHFYCPVKFKSWYFYRLEDIMEEVQFKGWLSKSAIMATVFQLRSFRPSAVFIQGQLSNKTKPVCATQGQEVKKWWNK